MPITNDVKLLEEAYYLVAPGVVKWADDEFEGYISHGPPVYIFEKFTYDQADAKWLKEDEEVSAHDLVAACKESTLFQSVKEDYDDFDAATSTPEGIREFISSLDVNQGEDVFNIFYKADGKIESIIKSNMEFDKTPFTQTP